MRFVGCTGKRLTNKKKQNTRLKIECALQFLPARRYPHCRLVSFHFENSELEARGSGGTFSARWPGGLSCRQRYLEWNDEPGVGDGGKLEFDFSAGRQR